MVFPGFFPLGIPKVQRNANLVDLKIVFNATKCGFLATVAVDKAENEPSKVWQPASLTPTPGVE